MMDNSGEKMRTKEQNTPGPHLCPPGVYSQAGQRDIIRNPQTMGTFSKRRAKKETHELLRVAVIK